MASPNQVVAAKRAVMARARQEFAESGTDGLAEVGQDLLRQLRLEHLPGWEGMPPPVTYFDGNDEQRRSIESYRAMLTEVQLSLLQEIIGNPFRRPNFDQALRCPAVIDLAQSVYDERAFERLPILADALQNAGCENEQLLTHCRQPGPHVRGCWALDLVLGRK
jgi:hypothetical protein